MARNRSASKSVLACATTAIVSPRWIWLINRSRSARLIAERRAIRPALLCAAGARGLGDGAGVIEGGFRSAEGLGSAG